jgi:hypothetical protein
MYVPDHVRAREPLPASPVGRRCDCLKLLAVAELVGAAAVAGAVVLTDGHDPEVTHPTSDRSVGSDSLAVAPRRHA